MNFLSYILPPLLGGAIALSTNWLALVMLFRPHREKRIFGVKVPFTPGLIPKEQKRLAKSLADVISKRLLTPEVLIEELSDLSVWPLPDMTVGEALKTVGIESNADLAAPLGDRLKDIVEIILPKVFNAAVLLEKHPKINAKFEEFVYKTIDENVSRLAGIFISKEKIYRSIKENAMIYLVENHEEIKEQINAAIDTFFAEENNAVTEKIYNIHIKDWLSEILQKEKHAVKRVLEIFARYLATNMPVQKMIENRIATVDVAEAEEIILAVARRELRLIVLLGGLLGFIVGLIAVII